MAVAEQSISLKTRRKTEVRIILGWHNKKLTTDIAVSYHYNIFYLADISTSITSKDG